MATSSLLTHGAQLEQSPKFAPIFTNRFFTGLWTQRNPLRDAATPYLYEKFYSGSRYESLIGGTNVEVSNRLTLVRRPGLTVWNSNNTIPPVNRFYSFRRISGNAEQISVIADTATTVADVTPGVGYNAFLTKAAGAGTAYMQSIGNVLYIGDGVEQVKYLNTGSGWGTQGWGIAAASGSSTVGPNLAGTGANAGGGGQAWTNPNNVTNTGSSYATVATSAPATATNSPSTGGSISQGVGPLQDGSTSTSATGYAFSLPSSAVIQGIQVTVNRFVTGSGLANSGTFTNAVQLLKAGSPVGNIEGPGAAYTTTSTQEVWGGTNDLWGTTWAFTDINNLNFGVTLQADYTNTSNSNGVVHVIGFIIEVFYSVGSGPTYSQALIASTFGFSVSSLTPSGVLATFKAGATAFDQLTVQLVVGGSPVGTPKTLSGLVSSPGTYTLGGSGDLWGYPLLLSQVNASSFGLSFIASNGAATTSVNNVNLTVYFTSAPTATPTGSGTMAATKGYEYVICYGNSITGHVSNAGTPSQNTGPFTAKDQVAVTVLASSDSQVNQIRVFRSIDGDFSAFYELPNSPFANTSTTINDTAGDPGSTTYPQLNVLSQAPITLKNSPPPVGLIALEYHNQRVWGIVGNTVYYTKSPGDGIGVGPESFPPINTFVYPSQGTRLLSTSVGLLVFTVSEVWIILGDGASTPYYTTIFCRKLGLTHWDALTEADTDIIMMAMNGEVVRFNPISSLNTLTGVPTGNVDKTEIGFPIGDLFTETYTPSQTFVTWHVGSSLDKALYVADGSTGWYRWAYFQMPENAAAWSPKAAITNGCGCVQSVETAPGLFQLLVAPTSTGIILARNIFTWADNAVPYQWDVEIGNVVVAQPGQVAALDFIEVDCNATGQGLAGLGILYDELFGSFNVYTTWVTDPTWLPQPKTVIPSRYYTIQGAGPTIARHIQVQLIGNVTNTQDEILAYSIFGSIRQET